MVKAAKHLKELTLLQMADENVVPEIIGSVSSVSLEEVCITGCRIHLSELLAFLDIHKRTLIDFEFSGACVLDGTCKDLVAWIRNHLVRLERLVIEDVCDHGMGMHLRGVTKSYFIEKDEDMQACLADIPTGRENERTESWRLKTKELLWVREKWSQTGTEPTTASTKTSEILGADDTRFSFPAIWLEPRRVAIKMHTITGKIDSTH